MRLPNFFIAGAAKSGTTSLWQYLKNHPDIFMPDKIQHKEPSFFCNYYGIKDWNKYLKLFEKAGDKKLVGEASGSYLTCPQSPQMIKEVIPDPKFIIMLRNPVERAYSLYNWMAKEGYEWIPTFEKALEEENHRIHDKFFEKNNPEYFYNYLYFNSGLYSKQLERFFATFGRKNIHIILYDDFKSDTVVNVQKVLTFLGANASYMPHLALHNKGTFVKSVKVQYFLKQKFIDCFPTFLRKKKKSKKIIVRMQKKMMRWNETDYAPKLLSATADRLKDLYKTDIKKTASLIDRDLSNWLD